jgi:hypothetical protein
MRVVLTLIILGSDSSSDSGRNASAGHDGDRFLANATNNLEFKVGLI